MNKKVIVVSLLAALLAPATQGFAQKAQIIKKLNPAKLERMVTQSTARLAPRVPGVYIPAGTTVAALERQVALTAQKAGIKLDEKDVRVIAYNPERLRQFQAQAGMPIFEGRPLPYKQGMKVLQANQEKFAQARANGEYENAWAEFIEERGYVDFAEGKSYGEMPALATDVYNFTVKHIGVENLPRVRMMNVPDMEGVVCEIPVNGLDITTPNGTIDVNPDKYVVIHYNNGRSLVIYRNDGLFESDGYRVIK